MEFTDSHAHLASEEVYTQVDAIVSRAEAALVKTIVNICTDPLTLERGISLSKRYPNIYNTAATTPHDVEKEGESAFPIIKAHALAKKLVAIGETGLDYHYTHSPKELQQDFLRRYLHLALECQLPVVIHCRDAFADFFSILDSDYVVNGKHQKGVLHCFTGTVEEASEVLARGFYLSISGIATFKKSEQLRDVIRMTPLEQLLIETDTPYLAPQSHRGELNEPAYLVEIAKVVANVKGIDLKEVAKVTSANAKALFNLRA